MVDLISDDDDERDTKRAIHSDATAESTPKPDNPVISSFLSERAQLEKERRERQKRLRGIQDGEDQPFAKRLHPSSPLRQNDTRSSTLSSLASSSSSGTLHSHSPTHTNTNTNTKNGEQHFFDGELRQTATEFADPRKDGQPTFRLTEILGNVRTLL